MPPFGCIICHSLFASGQTSKQMLMIGACGHTFHNDCLQNWFVRSKSCPVCRAKVDSTACSTANCVHRIHLTEVDPLNDSTFYVSPAAVAAPEALQRNERLQTCRQKVHDLIGLLDQLESGEASHKLPNATPPAMPSAEVSVNVPASNPLTASTIEPIPRTMPIKAKEAAATGRAMGAIRTRSAAAGVSRPGNIPIVAGPSDPVARASLSARPSSAQSFEVIRNHLLQQAARPMARPTRVAQSKAKRVP